MSKKKNYIPRRDFLSLLGITGANVICSPLEMFLSSFQKGMIKQAHAAVNGDAPRNFLYVQLAGGPSRWMWDLFLNPNGESLIYNAGVATRFNEVAGRYTEAYYSTALIKGLQVPHLWTVDIPAVNNTTRPMAELLNNMLVLRGFNTGDPGHLGSSLKHLQATGSSPSIPGVVSDAHSAKIPMVSVNNVNTRFVSEKGSSVVSLVAGGSGRNLFDSLLGPFSSTNASVSYQSQIKLIESSINQALDGIGANISSYAPGISADRKNAEEIIRQGVGDLNTSWNDLYSKYEDLASRALFGIYPGINDKPIGDLNIGSRPITYQFQDGNMVHDPDLRDILQPASTIRNVAAHFAMAEFVLMNGYSSSVGINLSNLQGLKAIINGSERNMTFGFDQHNYGAMIITYFQSLICCAWSSCLLELFSQMKSKTMANGKTLFDETVTHVAGEFNRNSRTDGRGTDHGYEAMSVSLFNGKIQGPQVIGNIYDKPPVGYGSHQGTWGYGAPVAEMGNRILTNGHMISSVAELLRIKSPSPNNEPMIKVSDSGVISLIGNAKMIKVGG